MIFPISDILTNTTARTLDMSVSFSSLESFMLSFKSSNYANFMTVLIS